MSKFIATSRQATGLDKTRVLLEMRIQEVKEESKKWVGVAAQAKEKTTELQKLIEELKIDVAKKGTHLDHLQKKNTELSSRRPSNELSSRRPSNTLIFWTPIM